MALVMHEPAKANVVRSQKKEVIETERIQKSLIVKGRVRDKQQLIKIVISQARKMFPFVGDVEVVALSSLNLEIGEDGGYTAVVEGCINREAVAEKDAKRE
jgi:hypothetical protein